MTWMMLAVLSAVFLGLYDVAKKVSVQENAVLPVLFACSASGLVLLAPMALTSLFAPTFAARHGFALQSLPLAAHGLVFAKAMLVTLSWVLTYFALKHLPLSLASPIRASAPMFTLFGATLFFAERPSLRQWLGIAIILCAYWIFSLIGRTEGIRFQKNPWVWSLFAGTLVGALSGLYDKHLLQSAKLPPLTMQFWFTAYNTVIQALIVRFLWWPRRANTTPFRFKPAIVAVAALLLLADALYFQCLSMEGAMVGIVSTLRRTNVVLSFAVGALVFGEKNRGKKAFALAGILAGIFLIV